MSIAGRRGVGREGPNQHELCYILERALPCHDILHSTFCIAALVGSNGKGRGEGGGCRGELSPTSIGVKKQLWGQLSEPSPSARPFFMVRALFVVENVFIWSVVLRCDRVKSAVWTGKYSKFQTRPLRISMYSRHMKSMHLSFSFLFSCGLAGKESTTKPVG